MKTTGSRTAFGMRPLALRLLLGGAVLLGLLLMATVLAAVSDAGSGAKVTINSTGTTETDDTDFGDCDTTPASGTCNLRQAINYANDGHANEINFHPPVFSKASPGLINLEDNCLDANLHVSQRLAQCQR